MMSNIDDDRITLKEKVEDALRVLIGQHLIQKNGDVYVFLTNEEQEINMWIEREDIDNADVINKISELIFDDIFTDKKYRYPKFNGRYTFGFNQSVDDRPYKTSPANDIGVRVLTPASEITDEITKRMMSGQGKEILVVLPNDRSFMDEIQMYLKIERFLRHNTSSSVIQYESIKDTKRREMSDRFANAKLFLSESLKDAEIYVNGDRAEIKSKDVTTRINEALQRLVETVYNKLSYIDAPLGDDEIRKLFAASNQFSMKVDETLEANHLALQDVLAYIDGNTQMHMKTSMKSVRDRFMRAPYGFIEEDVDYLVAKLFKRGDISFTVNGAAVNLLNKSKEEIIDYITKKQFAEKLMMERKVRISDRDKKICKDVMKELFQIAPTNDDEDAMMQLFIHASSRTITDLKELLVRYENRSYPGRDTVLSGVKLLSAISESQSAEDFYKLIARWKDSLLHFADDYEPIRGFFKGEQKQIFDEALRLMKIYNDSKTYIVNEELENTVADVKNILSEKEPYRDIPKLPELLDSFRNIYGVILDEQEKPVKSSIDDSYQRVMEVLDTKSYVAEKKASYGSQFKELFDGVENIGKCAIFKA